MRRRLLAALVMALVVSLLAFWALGTDRSPPQDALTGDEPALRSDLGTPSSSEGASAEEGGEVQAPILHGRAVPEEPLSEDEAGVLGLVLNVADGSPVPGVRVVVTRYVDPDAAKDARVILGSGRANEKGEFVVRVPGVVRGDAEVRGLGSGWVHADQSLGGSDRLWTAGYAVQLTPGSWSTHNTYVTRGGVVNGRALLADGSLAAGASIRPVAWKSAQRADRGSATRPWPNDRVRSPRYRTTPLRKRCRVFRRMERASHPRWDGFTVFRAHGLGLRPHGLTPVHG